MDRLLHGGIEVLHPEAHAVESKVGQVLEPRSAHGPRVNLDGDLGFRQEAKCLAQRRHESRQLGVVKERGRTAAEVELRDRLAGTQPGHVQIDLALQGVQILRCAPVIACHHLVAGAVVAHRFAERDVHVQRQRLRAPDRSCALCSLAERLRILRRAEGVDETVGGGVRGVARAGLVQAPQQFLGDRRSGGGGMQRHETVLCRFARRGS